MASARAARPYIEAAQQPSRACARCQRRPPTPADHDTFFSSIAVDLNLGLPAAAAHDRAVLKKWLSDIDLELVFDHLDTNGKSSAGIEARSFANKDSAALDGARGRVRR